MDIVGRVEDTARRSYKRRFSSALLALRADASITSQAAIATRVGVSEATYRRWEDLEDVRLPDLWEARLLCEELHCEPDDLLDPPEFTSRERGLAAKALRAARRGVGRAHRESGRGHGDA